MTNKITPLKLCPAARSVLETRKQLSGTPFVQTVEEALLKEDRFNTKIEAEITEYQQTYGCSRLDAIESMLTEALILKGVENTNKPAKKPSSIAQPFPADAVASAALKSAVSGLKPKPPVDVSTAPTSRPASTGQKHPSRLPKSPAPAPK